MATSVVELTRVTFVDSFPAKKTRVRAWTTVLVSSRTSPWNPVPPIVTDSPPEGQARTGETEVIVRAAGSTMASPPEMSPAAADASITSVSC
jgi:hypothetical protein